MKSKPAIQINLNNLDVYFLIDKSGSMSRRVGELPRGVVNESPQDTRLTRYKYCEETIIPFATQLAAYDDDGVTLAFFNREFTLMDNVKNLDIAGLFTAQNPGGGTALAAPLTEVLNLATNRCGEKQQFIVVMTDGEPDSQSAVMDAIVNATKKIKENGKVCILFLQVGDDAGAAKFLATLDSGLERYGAVIDMVAVKHIDAIAGRPLVDVVTEAFNN